MSRCAGCGHEHGLVEGWCDECIASGKRLSGELAASARENTRHALEYAREHGWRGARLSIENEHALPLEGYVYVDALERRLRVLKVDVRARGREVVGLIAWPGMVVTYDGPITPTLGNGPKDGLDYSTDLKTWAAIWRDKAPPPEPSAMKIG